ncbi:MAG: DUF6125 family protein [Dehalococcoidales bacterium]|nr:DUF6125 family protein [Dehalococcoidales bacterium]
MADLNEQQKTDYFHRGFTAVDGLWFMKIEEHFGFDKALEIDNEVWKVLPKIQARKMKELKKVGTGIDALMECFPARLLLEGFTFKIEKDEKAKAFRLVIDSCPWHKVMVKSGRQHLSAKVGNVICPSDYSGWASEFGCKFQLDEQNRICNGSKLCILHFSQ